MFNSGIFSSISHGLGIFLFFFRRKMIPEESDTKGAISSLKSFFQTFQIIHISFNNFSSKLYKFFCLICADITGNGTYIEFMVGIVQNCPHKSTSLGSCSTNNNNCLLSIHPL